MSISAKTIWGISIVLVMAGLAAVSQFVPVQQAQTRLPGYTTNAGELTRDVLVGQTFVADQDNLSGIAVLFATYSNRRNTQPVVFHLRESIAAGRSLRTAQVDPAQLGDNQFHRFTFEPIPDSRGKTYFFFIVSPDSTPGNAVTVDLDTRDPYHLGSAYLVRNQGPAVTDPVTLARSGKPTVDVAFSTYYTVPARVALLSSARASAYGFITSWDDQRGRYEQMLQVAIPAVMLLVFIAVVMRLSVLENEGSVATRRTVLLALAFLVLAGSMFRYLYARELPITNDEGNYLYDARTLRWGIASGGADSYGPLAGGDGYVKAPLVIVWLLLWQAVFGDTVMAGRLAMVVASALTALPIYLIGTALLNRRAGLIGAAVWSLAGITTVFGIYIHTQAVSLCFGIAGIALIALATRGLTLRWSVLPPLTAASLTRWFLLGGILLGMGVASRKSILALGLVPLVLILTTGLAWRQKMKQLVWVGIGFSVVIALFLGFGYGLYGMQGVWEAVGFNSAEDGVNAVTPDDVDQVRAYNLRGMTPFFREGLPLILLALLGWGYVLEQLARALVRRLLKRRPTPMALHTLDHVVPKLAWLLPLAVFAWCFRFFFEYEGEAFMFLGMPVLWYLMGALLLLAALWPRPQSEQFEFEDDPIVAGSTQPKAKQYLNVVGAISTKRDRSSVSRGLSTDRILLLLTAALVPAVWLGGLTYFYSNWIKFHANYIAEFLPPLALAGGLGAYYLWHRLLHRDLPWGSGLVKRWARWKLIAGSTIIIFWALWLSGFITFIYEHTGTFDQRAVVEAAVWAREHIPLEEPIFTGAATVPYLSGHHVSLDIAHPRWYAYEFTRTDTARLETFLPSIEEMLSAYRSAKWILLEQQTGFSFLMEYTEIERGIEQDFELVHEIENLGNPLKFYRRR